MQRAIPRATRRAILASPRLASGETAVTELAGPFDMRLPAISKHLELLERAALIAQPRGAVATICASCLGKTRGVIGSRRESQLRHQCANQLQMVPRQRAPAALGLRRLIPSPNADIIHNCLLRCLRFEAALLGIVEMLCKHFCRALVWLAIAVAVSADPSAAQSWPPSPAKAEKRLALVIGNGAYAHVSKLANPANDARLVASALQKVGFDVTMANDLTRSDHHRVLREFVDKVSAADSPVVLLFFAGQGVEVGGRNYLMPVDVLLKNDADMASDGVPLDAIVTALEAANENSINFLVIDACRDNPFAQVNRGLVPRGFTAPETGDRTIVLYSTRAGAVAEDGYGSNSPFTESFARNVQKAGLEWADVYRAVQREVVEMTRGRQKPQMYGLPPRQFYFVSAPAPEALPRAERDPLTTASRVPITDEKGQQTYAYHESYALLVGVSQYEQPKAWTNLPGVKEDVDIIEAVLRDMHGFRVTKVLDPKHAGLVDAIGDFIKVNGRKEDARLLIYFAGHGTTTTIRGRKIGWIVPSDAPHPNDAPAEFTTKAVSMRRIEEFSEYIESKHVLWIFDSCFSGAIFDMTHRANIDKQWEDYLLARPVRRVITSGSDGEEVPDTSVFRELLVDALTGKRPVAGGKKTFTGNELGLYLKEEVIKYRRQKQTPQNGTVLIRGLDEGDILFRLEDKLVKASQR